MRILLTTVLVLISFFAFSQSSVSTRISSGIDVGAGFKTDYTVPSITYYELLNLDANRIFSVGWTIKGSAFYGDNLNYITAPAKLSRGKTGFPALSAPLIPENLDTLRYDWVTGTSLNLGLRAQIRVGPVEVGGSADILGLSFGKNRTARYISSSGQYEITKSNTEKDTVTFRSSPGQRAKPQTLNLRLLGDNDYGTLATEVYVRLQVTRRVGLRVAYQWITTEMRASNKNLIDGNDRFRNTASMAYVGLTLPFFK
ncbi:hypothetical protein [Larkinella soli]|uniref:hypothetical protein n=1 Tax=Larkinella soli TaxID=1770527 RepID=UPI000FFB1B95|nr:hypothetical protein [Larkinella soli]